MDLKVLKIYDTKDFDYLIKEFQKAIDTKNKNRIASCVLKWNEYEEKINILIETEQRVTENKEKRNKYINFLTKNIEYINNTNKNFLKMLKESRIGFNNALYIVHKNNLEKDILKEYVDYEFKTRTFHIEQAVLKLYDNAKIYMKSELVEEFAWIETYIKNCIDQEDKDKLKANLEQINEDDKNNEKVMSNITNHIKKKINKNVKKLGLTKDTKSKEVYKVFDSKGKYSAMTGSGRPDVVLRKNDGGIAYTYANHFQNTYMEGDQAERHSGIVLETEYRYQQKQKKSSTKGVTWGEIFNNVNAEYKGIKGQRENWNEINNLESSKDKKDKEKYEEYRKIGNKMVITSYQNLDASTKKIRNMVKGYLEQMYSETISEDDERLEYLVEVHQGIMVMAQDFNNGIYEIKENEDDMISLEGSNLFKEENKQIYGPSMKKPLSRTKLYKRIREKFLDQKIIEDSLGIITHMKFDKEPLRYDENSLTFNNEMNLLKPGGKTESKKAYSVKKEDVRNVGDEESQLYALYMLFTINSMVNEQMKGVFETIVNRIMERIKQLSKSTEKYKIKAQDVDNLVKEIQNITGKNTNDKLNTMLLLIQTLSELEKTQENLEATQENLEATQENLEATQENLDNEIWEIIETNELVGRYEQMFRKIKQYNIKLSEVNKKLEVKDFTLKVTKYLVGLQEEKQNEIIDYIKTDEKFILEIIENLSKYKGDKKILQEKLNIVKEEIKNNKNINNKEDKNNLIKKL